MDIVSYLKGCFPLPYTSARIDADAASILSSATRAVKIILERRAELDKSGMKHKPLIVLSGENHAKPAHYVHHILVAEELARAESLSVAVELPHNLLTRDLTSTLDGDELLALAELDRKRHGALSLNSYIAFADCMFADHSRITYYNMLSKRKIRFQPVDAAQKFERFDYEDGATDKSIKAYEAKKGTSVLKKAFQDERVTSQSMDIRNLHMAGMSADFAIASGARILIVNCGNNHVVGHTGKEHEFSLSALFKRRNLPVIAMVLKDGKNISDAHLLQCAATSKEPFIISVLPETDAIYNGKTGQLCNFRKAEMRSREAESGYLQGLLQGVQKDEFVMSLAGREEIRQSARVEMSVAIRATQIAKSLALHTSVSELSAIADNIGFMLRTPA